MKVKSESEVAQSCPTLRDTMDYSLPGPSVHLIFQARVLEWGASAFTSCTCKTHIKFKDCNNFILITCLNDNFVFIFRPDFFKQLYESESGE